MPNSNILWSAMLFSANKLPKVSRYIQYKGIRLSSSLSTDANIFGTNDPNIHKTSTNCKYDGFIDNGREKDWEELTINLKNFNTLGKYSQVISIANEIRISKQVPTATIYDEILFAMSKIKKPDIVAPVALKMMEEAKHLKTPLSSLGLSALALIFGNVTNVLYLWSYQLQLESLLGDQTPLSLRIAPVMNQLLFTGPFQLEKIVDIYEQASKNFGIIYKHRLSSNNKKLREYDILYPFDEPRHDNDRISKSERIEQIESDLQRRGIAKFIYKAKKKYTPDSKPFFLQQLRAAYLMNEIAAQTRDTSIALKILKDINEAELYLRPDQWCGFLVLALREGDVESIRYVFNEVILTNILEPSDAILKEILIYAGRSGDYKWTIKTLRLINDRWPLNENKPQLVASLIEAYCRNFYNDTTETILKAESNSTEIIEHAKKVWLITDMLIKNGAEISMREMDPMINLLDENMHHPNNNMYKTKGIRGPERLLSDDEIYDFLSFGKTLSHKTRNLLVKVVLEIFSRQRQFIEVIKMMEYMVRNNFILSIDDVLDRDVFRMLLHKSHSSKSAKLTTFEIYLEMLVKNIPLTPIEYEWLIRNNLRGNSIEGVFFYLNQMQENNIPISKWIIFVIKRVCNKSKQFKYIEWLENRGNINDQDPEKINAPFGSSLRYPSVKRTLKDRSFRPGYTEYLSGPDFIQMNILRDLFNKNERHFQLRRKLLRSS